MEKPSGICIYPKDNFDEALFCYNNTDLNSVIVHFLEFQHRDFSLSDVIILYFYDRNDTYEFKSDLFND